MELFVWPSDFGLPSNDVACLQFMAASKFCAAPITIVHSTAAWKSPTGTLPYFQSDDEVITDFDAFVEFLRNSKQDVVLDSDNSPEQRCEFDAYSALIRQKLHPAMQVIPCWLVCP
ncbi:Metaxin 1 [Aphelenchoides avenae]|nr:Metaxin 1 [Aphelenchus avenae]